MVFKKKEKEGPLQNESGLAREFSPWFSQKADEAF